MNQEQKSTIENTASNNSKGEVLERVLRCFIAAGAAFILSVLLLVLISFGISKGWLDVRYLAVYATVCCLLSPLLAVKLVRHFLGEISIVAGLLVGVCYGLLLLLFGYIGYGALQFEQGGLWSLAACLLGGTAGGVSLRLGRGKKKTRNRRK